MDILIKNIEMPKKGEVMKLYLCSDGDVGYDDDGKPYKTTAIELPSHARLKDESVIIQNMEDAFCKLFPIDGTHKQVLVSECHKAFLKAVFDAPVVLEAST